MRPVTSAPLPEWFHPLAENAANAEGGMWTRLRPPDGKGRDSAVLMLLGEAHHGPDMLICQRAANMNNHAGQPAFPGGGTEPGDADPAATALREAYEEVGLDPASVEVVTTLPELWIPVSGFRVTPVLAWWRAPHPVFPVQTAEVERVERVPIAELADPANRVRARHPSGYSSPAFDVRDMLVWGFTAGLVSILLDLAGWTRPWSQDRVVPVEVIGATVPDPAEQRRRES